MSGQKKQIEEMAWEICDIPRHDSYKSCKECNCYGKCHAMYYAKRAYDAGYSKQRDGENIGAVHPVDEFKCSVCGITLEGWSRVVTDEDDGELYYYEYEFKYCPNCGAKMKGGDA